MKARFPRILKGIDFGSVDWQNPRRLKVFFGPRNRSQTKENGVMEELIVPTLRKRLYAVTAKLGRATKSRQEPRGSQKTSGILWKPEERPQGLPAGRSNSAEISANKLEGGCLCLRANYLSKAGRRESRTLKKRKIGALV